MSLLINGFKMFKFMFQQRLIFSIVFLHKCIETLLMDFQRFYTKKNTIFQRGFDCLVFNINLFIY